METIASVQNQLTDRPLLVCDIDEVILEFLTPLQNYLQNNGCELRANSFSLNGNIFEHSTNQYLSDNAVKQHINEFYNQQAIWQDLVDGSWRALNNLKSHVDIVLLTAMPPNHYQQRRKLLDKLDINFPLIASENNKGPAVRELHNNRDHPSFFIDDMIYNHVSIAEYTPQTHKIYFMANAEFNQIAPKRPKDVIDADNWQEIEQFIFDRI